MSEPQVAVGSHHTIWVTVPLANEVRGIDLAAGRTTVIRTGEGRDPALEIPLGIAVGREPGSLLLSDRRGSLVTVRITSLSSS